MMIASAQISSEYVPAPKILRERRSVTVSRRTVPCRAWSTGCGVGDDQRQAAETENSMPSVVMNDEMPTTAVMTPLMSPTTQHASMRQDQRTAISGMPAWLNS